MPLLCNSLQLCSRTGNWDVIRNLEDHIFVQVGARVTATWAARVGSTRWAWPGRRRGCAAWPCAARGGTRCLSATPREMWSWDRAEWWSLYSRCGMEWTPPGCVKELSPSLSYPACCPRVVCPQDSEASDQGEPCRVLTPFSFLWPFLEA